MAQNSGQTVYRVNARQAQAQGRGQGQGLGLEQSQGQGRAKTTGGGESAPLPGQDQARQVALAMTQLNMGVPGRKKGTIIGALAGGSGGEEIISTVWNLNIFLWNRDQW